MSFRAGFVGLIGEPNAGKSSLMNYLVEEKVSIVSSKPQTTRRRVLGVWTGEAGQVIFVDAPGLLKAARGLNGYLAREAREVIGDSDALVAVLAVDADNADVNVETLELVSAAGKPWIAFITKADLKDKAHRVMILRDMVEKKGGKAYVVSVKSAPRGSEVAERLATTEELRTALLAMLPEAPAPLFDRELFTPETERRLVAEIVREKCFEHLHQEIPFGLGVRVIRFDEAADVPRLALEILVSKPNHKAIVIGKGGSQLKAIGIDARKDIEKLLGGQVFLELNVSVKPNWAENHGIMKELGYVHDKKRD